MEALSIAARAVGLDDLALELQNAAQRDGAHVTVVGLGVMTSAALYWLLSTAGTATLNELQSAGEAVLHTAESDRVRRLGQALIDGCQQLNIAAMPAHDMLARGGSVAA